jgi:hypothetical protein
MASKGLQEHFLSDLELEFQSIVPLHLNLLVMAQG